ncbi:hypothetical protein C7443_10757 [Plasticicumulans acidivorans]|uniref:Uncharacterized protein n=1 Tax=Plasticicumulans acidivorans TaxID=886464 RepID=A0A317MSY7_9GAMM|nr:hypothetical protein C7443_10757 [Plasticicumulans acidivorans]
MSAQLRNSHLTIFRRQNFIFLETPPQLTLKTWIIFDNKQFSI